MTLNQLEYFCAVCRYHSISKAAEELFVSQPAISVAIRDLENEFHLRLLNHAKNRISPTQEGIEFYKRAEMILGQTQDMYSDFSQLASTAKPVRIAIPPLMSTVFFPRMIDAFHESYSDVPVQLYEYGSVRARTLLDSGALDIALVNMDFYNLENYNSQILMEDSLVYCVSRNHRFAEIDNLSLEMMKDERIILLNTDSVQTKLLKSKFNALKFKPNIIMYCSQLNTTLNFLRGGDCGAFLYSSLAVNPRDFVKIPLASKTSTNFGFIWKTGTFIPQNTAKFIEFAKHYDTSMYID
jgi:DNA-binding transcriptional LysR family regulator